MSFVLSFLQCTHNINLILLTSILAAITICGTFHYTKYVVFQFSVAVQAFDSLSSENLAAAKVLVNYGFEKETGYSGFLGYMIYKANQGVSLGKVYSSSRLNLSPFFTWIYWLIEFGIIAYLIIPKEKKTKIEKNCPYCHSKQLTTKHIGGVTANQGIVLMELIKQKDFEKIGKILQETSDIPSLVGQTHQFCQHGKISCFAATSPPVYLG